MVIIDNFILNQHSDQGTDIQVFCAVRNKNFGNVSFIVAFKVICRFIRDNCTECITFVAKVFLKFLDLLPSDTKSPSFLTHDPMLPFSIVGDNAGNLMTICSGRFASFVVSAFGADFSAAGSVTFADFAPGSK